MAYAHSVGIPSRCKTHLVVTPQDVVNVLQDGFFTRYDEVWYMSDLSLLNNITQSHPITTDDVNVLNHIPRTTYDLVNDERIFACLGDGTDGMNYLTTSLQLHRYMLRYES